MANGENFEDESRKIEFGIFSFDLSEIEEEEIFGTIIEFESVEEIF